MFLRRYAIWAFGAALVTSSGCGPSAVKRACMGGSGGGNALVDGAAMMRLDVYDPSVACVDGVLPDGAGSPVLSHSYVAGQTISLDLPPGAHTLVLTTFADQAGTVALGQACTTETLQPGSQICFDLTVLPAPLGDDLSVVSCTVTPNSCPAGYYCDGTSCQNGCASDQDCANGPDGGASIATHCDPVSHGCVECVTTSDCGPSQICTAGHCIANCTSTQKLCNGVCIPQASCCMNSDCTMPPAPVACYTGACTTPGSSCSYTKKSGAIVCGSTCCNAINGTCNGTCGLTCSPGFADCNGDPSDGCETNLGASGKKLCNGMCIPQTGCCNNNDCMTPPVPQACYAMMGSCPAPGGTCQYTENTGSQICNGTTCCNAINGTCNGNCTLNCAPGTGDCDGSPSDGCETNTNTNPAHCGSCMNACNLPHTATDGCSNGNCTIVTCAAGFYDCDGNPANGCEAAGPPTGPGCCTGNNPSTTGTAMIAHNNGYSGTFYDCYPVAMPGVPSTYNATMALDAANSYTAQPGTATASWTCGNGTSAVTSVCKSVDPSGKSGTCTCWAYQSGGAASADAIVGHTFNNTGNNGCRCQQSTDPPWGN